MNIFKQQKECILSRGAYSRDRKNLQTSHHCVIISGLFLICYLFLNINAKCLCLYLVKEKKDV